MYGRPEPRLMETYAFPRIPRERQPYLTEVARAYWDQENLIGSALQAQRYAVSGMVDESFDLWDELPDQYRQPEVIKYFGDIYNRDDMNLRIRQVEREQKNKKIMAKGGLSGLGLGIVIGGFLDPLNLLIPAPAAIKGARIGSTFLRNAGRTAAFGAGAIALTEAGLAATQQTRDIYEVTANIGAGTLLSGLLGGAVSMLPNQARRQLGKQLEAEGATRITTYMDDEGRVYTREAPEWDRPINMLEAGEPMTVGPEGKAYQPGSYPVALRRDRVFTKDPNTTLDRAYQMEFINEADYKIGKYLVNEVGDVPDSRVMFDIMDAVGYADIEGRQMALKGAFDSKNYGPYRVGIKLYKGHDATTTLHEWAHYWWEKRLTGDLKAKFNDWYKQQHSKMSVEEYYADRFAVDFISSGKAEEVTGQGLLSLFSGARKVLKRLINWVKYIDGQRVPKEIQDLIESPGVPHQRNARIRNEKIAAGEIEAPGQFTKGETDYGPSTPEPEMQGPPHPFDLVPRRTYKPPRKPMTVRRWLREAARRGPYYVSEKMEATFQSEKGMTRKGRRGQTIRKLNVNKVREALGMLPRSLTKDRNKAKGTLDDLLQSFIEQNIPARMQADYTIQDVIDLIKLEPDKVLAEGEYGYMVHQMVADQEAIRMAQIEEQGTLEALQDIPEALNDLVQSGKTVDQWIKSLPKDKRNDLITRIANAEDETARKAIAARIADEWGESSIEALEKRLKAEGYDEERIGIILEEYLDEGQAAPPITDESGRVLFQVEEVVDRTETPAFKKWFGDSVVVDNNGRPRVMYHGTHHNKPIEQIDLDKTQIGFHVGTTTQANQKIKSFLNPTTAHSNAPSNVYPVYVRIEKPFRMKDVGFFNAENVLEEMKNTEILPGSGLTMMDEVNYQAYKRKLKDFEKEPISPKQNKQKKNTFVRDLLKQYGYDGIVYQNRYEVGGMRKFDRKTRRNLDSGRYDYLDKLSERAEGYKDSKAEDSYIVFEAEQIKSAYNQGDWNPQDKRILYQIDEEAALDEALSLFDAETAADSNIAPIKGVSPETSKAILRFITANRLTGAAGAKVLYSKVTNAGKQLAEHLVLVPEILQKNLKGQGTTESAEIIKRRNVTGYVQKGQRRFFTHFVNSIKRSRGEGLVEEATGPQVAKASFNRKAYKAFKREVGQAVNELEYGRGIEQFTPDVQAAARELGQMTMEIGDRLRKAGLIPEPPEGEQPKPHFARSWRHDSIRKYRNDISEILLKELEESRKNDAAAKGNLSKANKGVVVDPAEVENALDSISGVPSGYMGFNDLSQAIDPNDFGTWKSKFLNNRILDVDYRNLIDVPIFRDGVEVDRVDFIEMDALKQFSRYVDSVMGSLTLTEKFGSVTMKDQFQYLWKVYNDAAKAAGKGAETTAIFKERDEVFKTMLALRDKVNGTYARTAGWEPGSMAYRVSKAGMSMNAMLMLGGMTVSSMADVTRPLWHWGFSNHANALQNYVSYYNSDAFKALRKEARDVWGAAISGWNRERLFAYIDRADDWDGATWLEKGIFNLADNMGLFTGMDAWNATMKEITSFVTVHAVVDAAEKLRRAVDSGKIATLDMTSAKQYVKESHLIQMAQMGLGLEDLVEVARQVSKHGERMDGVYLPRTPNWDNPALRSRFESAMVKEIDQVITTPGLSDRPLWTHWHIGQMASQFKSFSFASMRGVIVQGLQKGDVDTLQGMMAALMAGASVYALKQVEANKPITDNPAELILNAADRGGLTSYLMDIDSIAHRTTGGLMSIQAMVGGEGASRFSSRSTADILLGPSAGTLSDTIGLGSRTVPNALRGRMVRSDMAPAFRLLPYKNVPYIRWLLERLRDSAEEQLPVRRDD